MPEFNLSPLVLPPLSLYVHMPWCVQKCPYCDFNSHVQKSHVQKNHVQKSNSQKEEAQKSTELPEDDYIDALLADLTEDIQRYKILESKRPLHSIFIGGGTPSLISPKGIGRLLQGIQAQIDFAQDIEISMEANPGTLESADLSEYKDQGINRISLGVQSFEQSKLKALGRIHNADEAISAARNAHQLGLKSFNLDLMHGLPDQTPAQALADLDQAIALEPPHLSWYQLTIEPNTLFYSQPPSLPDDDDLWEIYEQGHQKLAAAGYQQYEVSGYHKVNSKIPSNHQQKNNHQCQHNLNYWHFGDYLGIGCGAHGKISLPNLSDNSTSEIIRTTKIKHPKGYLSTHELLSKHKDMTKSYRDNEINVEAQDRPFEYFMNRFRLIEACPKQEFVERTGLPLQSIQPAIEQAITLGYLTQTDTHWLTSTKGRLFFNDLIELFVI